MKKIKLPLEMANGAMVRTIDELKENWDLEKVVEHFVTGKLTTWLNDRYYTDLAEKVQKITAKGAEAQKQLCDIFGMEFKQDEVVDAEELAERKRKLDLIRQYTSDEDVFKNIDHVAFNQEDLADLLDEGVEKIYLCDCKFVVPLSISGKEYIGLGNVEVYIGRDEWIDFDKLGIKFRNVKFDAKYAEVADGSPDKIYEEAMTLENDKVYDKAFEKFKKLADMNDDRGLFWVGKCYHLSLGIEQNFEFAKEYYEKAVMKGNAFAANNLGNMYKEGEGIEKNYQKAVELYQKAIDGGNKLAYYNLGALYYYGEDEVKDYGKAFKCYTEANDNAYAMYTVGQMYENGQGVDANVDKAIEYYQKAIDLGHYNEDRQYDSAYRCALVYDKNSYSDKDIANCFRKYDAEKKRKLIDGMVSNISNFSSGYFSVRIDVWPGTKSEILNRVQSSLQSIRNYILKQCDYVYLDYCDSYCRYVRLAAAACGVNVNDNELYDIKENIRSRIAQYKSNIPSFSASAIMSQFEVDFTNRHDGIFGETTYIYTTSSVSAVEKDIESSCKQYINDFMSDVNMYLISFKSTLNEIKKHI